ncbi:MAG: signal peptidase II [Anaerolineae bacterium]|nr:signal peptidase II [Anaerolineae bacterium]
MTIGGGDSLLSGAAIASARSSWLMLLAAAGPVLLADQASKAAVTARLALYEQVAPLPALESLFTFTLTHNTGGAFSLFPGARNVLLLTGLITVGVILFYATVLSPAQRAHRVALGILLGGALGNLLDRIRLGYVVDFLHVHGLPIFNVADIGIVGGVGLLLLLTWWGERRAHAIEADNEGSS